MKSNSDDRSARSGKELAYDQEIDAANDITERQNTLENFISDEAGEFLTGRSLRVNQELYTSVKHNTFTIINKEKLTTILRIITSTNYININMM